MAFRITKIVPIAISALLLFGLTSCGDINHDLRLQADGSGTLETSFEIGEMMSMLQGFDDMGAEDVTVSSDTEPDTALTPAKDPMEVLMEKVTDPAYDRDFDTLISFMNILPDSVKAKETRMDLLEKLSIRMKSPALSTDLTVGLVMNFDNPQQLHELINYLEMMDSVPSIMANANPGGLQSESFLVFEADMKAGWIRIDSIDYSEMAMEFGMSSDTAMSSEDAGMMEMMLGSTKIKSTIHVPGEVTSCTNVEAILTKDNKVIVEYGLLDAVKKGKADGYTIYFTPKK